MHINNACMFYAPYASIIVWKLQNGAKSIPQTETSLLEKKTCCGTNKFNDKNESNATPEH